MNEKTNQANNIKKREKIKSINNYKTNRQSFTLRSIIKTKSPTAKRNHEKF